MESYCTCDMLAVVQCSVMTAPAANGIVLSDSSDLEDTC